MNKCPRCGSLVPEEALFCMECGYKLEQNRVCPACGTRVSPTDKFCMHCGTILGGCLTPVSATEVSKTDTAASLASDYKSRSQRAQVMAGRMVCPSCGAEISDMNRVCPECGCRLRMRSGQEHSLDASEDGMKELKRPNAQPPKRPIVAIGIVVIIILLCILVYFIMNKRENYAIDDSETDRVEQVDTEQNMYDTNTTGIEDGNSDSDSLPND